MNAATQLTYTVSLALVAIFYHRHSSVDLSTKDEVVYKGFARQDGELMWLTEEGHAMIDALIHLDCFDEYARVVWAGAPAAVCPSNVL